MILCRCFLIYFVSLFPCWGCCFQIPVVLSFVLTLSFPCHSCNVLKLCICSCSLCPVQLLSRVTLMLRPPRVFPFNIFPVWFSDCFHLFLIVSFSLYHLFAILSCSSGFSLCEFVGTQTSQLSLCCLHDSDFYGYVIFMDMFSSFIEYFIYYLHLDSESALPSQYFSLHWFLHCLSWLFLFLLWWIRSWIPLK